MLVFLKDLLPQVFLQLITDPLDTGTKATHRDNIAEMNRDMNTEDAGALPQSGNACLVLRDSVCLVLHVGLFSDCF